MNKLMIWLKGLLSAAISSAAGSVGLVVVDPKTFNIQEGLANLGTVAAALAIVAVANYLKKSPLPE